MYLPKKMPLEYEVIPLEDVVVLGIAKDGTLYGRKQSDTAQMVKSTDGGHTWGNIVRVSPASPVEQILILDDNSIIIGTRGGRVLKSTDGGETAEVVFDPNAGGVSTWGGMDAYDRFVFLAPYRNSIGKIFMSNNYGNEGSWTEILHVKDTKVAHPHTVKFDPYENIIWTVWGDHRPADTIMFSDDFGATWQQPPKGHYYRCTNIIPLPNSVWFGTDEEYWIGAYRYERPTMGTSQSKFIPEPYWAARRWSDDIAPVCWATRPAVTYGKDGAAFWGYRTVGRIPTQIYATRGDKVYPIWCHDKLDERVSSYGIEGVYGPDDEGYIVATLIAPNELGTTSNLVRIKLGEDW